MLRDAIGEKNGKSLKISLDPQDFPWASPSGNLLGLGKSWASGMDFPICHHQQGRIDFNTVNPSLSTGKDFLIHSL